MKGESSSGTSLIEFSLSENLIRFSLCIDSLLDMARSNISCCRDVECFCCWFVHLPLIGFSCVSVCLFSAPFRSRLSFSGISSSVGCLCTSYDPFDDAFFFHLPVGIGGLASALLQTR